MALECIKLYFLFTSIYQCSAVSWRRQMGHIAKARLENEGIMNLIPTRRFYQFDPRELSSIIGVPSRPSHLPEAEPILPGHTLLRPALGMLKSAIKFPHRELEDGAGVYGNVDNLGIRYDSRNERLMYSGFRRFPSDYIMVIPSPSQVKYEKPRFKLKSAVLNLDREAQAKNEILKILKKLKVPSHKGVKVFIANDGDNHFEKGSSPATKEFSYYLHDNIPDRTLKENKEVLRTNGIAETNNSLESEEDKKKTKAKWMPKDSFDHIKIAQDAPDINDLIPHNAIADEELRKWWFYNSDDYKPLSHQESR